MASDGDAIDLEVPQSHTVTSRSLDLEASLLYLEREDVHDEVKPFKLQYDPGPGIPRTNCTNQNYDHILIRDLRGCKIPLSFDVNGIAVMHLGTKMTAEDFNYEERVKSIYYPELQNLLESYFQAERVEILEHIVRKRHVRFPISTGKDYDYLQPTAVAHIDFTMKSALEASSAVLQIQKQKYSRIQCINVWKPLRGPLTDWPLAVCDAQTVNGPRDCIAMDVVSRTGFTENEQVYYNSEHEWYYLSDQRPTDLLIFRQADTKKGCEQGVPHTGFANLTSDPHELPRESIETRVFIYY